MVAATAVLFVELSPPTSSCSAISSRRRRASSAPSRRRAATRVRAAACGERAMRTGGAFGRNPSTPCGSCSAERCRTRPRRVPSRDLSVRVERTALAGVATGAPGPHAGRTIDGARVVGARCGSSASVLCALAEGTAVQGTAVSLTVGLPRWREGGAWRPGSPRRVPLRTRMAPGGSMPRAAPA